MNMQQAIQTVLDKRDLSVSEMADVMRLIMTGEATPAQIGGFLIGLRMKGETVDEITAAASVMRELAAPVGTDAPNLVDIVGTGGDGAHTFNISTASSFVVAAAGGHVAKHGNRSVSSSSGSADLLETAGVNLQLTPGQVSDCIRDVGVGFMFAPLHHSAMKYAIGPRKEMGVRTVFNVLGPLTNPAKAPNLLLGVFSESLVMSMAEVLRALGADHVLIVYAERGLDEISIEGSTRCAELKRGEISSFSVKPGDFGISETSLNDIKVDTPEQSLKIILAVLDNLPGPARDAVALNAGAAIYVAGLEDSIQAGIDRALAVIADGTARRKLEALVDKTKGFA